MGRRDRCWYLGSLEKRQRSGYKCSATPPSEGSHFYVLNPSSLALRLSHCHPLAIYAASPTNRGPWLRQHQLLLGNLLPPSCGQPKLVSISTRHCPPIADGYPYRSISETGIQSSKPPASADAQPLGFTARFNLPMMNEPTSMDDHRFQPAPAMGQFPSSVRTTNFS